MITMDYDKTYKLLIRRPALEIYWRRSCNTVGQQISHLQTAWQHIIQSWIKICVISGAHISIKICGSINTFPNKTHGVVHIRKHSWICSVFKMIWNKGMLHHHCSSNLFYKKNESLNCIKFWYGTLFKLNTLVHFLYIHQVCT